MATPRFLAVGNIGEACNARRRSPSYAAVRVVVAAEAEFVSMVLLCYIVQKREAALTIKVLRWYWVLSTRKPRCENPHVIEISVSIIKITSNLQTNTNRRNCL